MAVDNKIAQDKYMIYIDSIDIYIGTEKKIFQGRDVARYFTDKRGGFRILLCNGLGYAFYNAQYQINYKDNPKIEELFASVEKTDNETK